MKLMFFATYEINNEGEAGHPLWIGSATTVLELSSPEDWKLQLEKVRNALETDFRLMTRAGKLDNRRLTTRFTFVHTQPWVEG